MIYPIYSMLFLDFEVDIISMGQNLRGEARECPGSPGKHHGTEALGDDGWVDLDMRCVCMLHN